MNHLDRPEDLTLSESVHFWIFDGRFGSSLDKEVILNIQRRLYVDDLTIGSVDFRHDTSYY